MNGAYDDIIHLPHHVSEKRSQMSGIDRAAQFSPFAALTGFGAAITETGRLTDSRIELDEYAKAALNEQFLRIQESLDAHPTVSVTFFQPDERKSGGAYLSITGAVKKIDEYERIVVMIDGQKVPIDGIVEITEGGANE